MSTPYKDAALAVAAAYVVLVIMVHGMIEFAASGDWMVSLYLILVTYPWGYVIIELINRFGDNIRFIQALGYTAIVINMSLLYAITFWIGKGLCSLLSRFRSRCSNRSP